MIKKIYKRFIWTQGRKPFTTTKGTALFRYNQNLWAQDPPSGV
jgi:hypothetical protein